jgi:hypothetical protein
MGFVIMVVTGVYLALSVLAVSWAIGHAKKNGLSAKRWGWSAALMMYLIPFWDWIPTVATHQFYCVKDAGYWAYKPLGQWKLENLGVIGTLVDNSPQKRYPNWPTEDWGEGKITSINQRIGLVYTNHIHNSREGELFLNVWRWQIDLVDKKTKEILARRVDFSTGNNGYIGGMNTLKFWLQSDSCINARRDSIRLGNYIDEIRGTRDYVR